MKVRIYKSPDGNGKYLNKTGQFLEKAQKGRIVKDVLKYGKQLIMNFDESDKIQKATELAKAIDKSNNAARAAGAIKYGEGIKKATTASSKIQIKNPAFFQDVLNISNISPSTRKYHEKIIEAVIKNNNLATQSQYNALQRIKNGTFPKYQLGGVPDVSEMGYPGSNSEEKKDLSQDELVNIISNDLNNDIDEQQIAFKLANFYDVDPMEAINLVSQVKNYLTEQNGSDYEYDFDEDEDEKEVVEEEVVEEEPYESQEEVDAAEDTQNNSFVSDMLLNEDEDEEEEEDDDEEKYGGQMAYGGLYKAQDGEEVEDVDTEIQQNGQVTYPFNPTAPGIVFPEIETYLPYNMADMLNGTVDPATGMYYNHYASKDINQNSEYENEDNSEEEEEESDVSSEYALDAPPEMKMGGNYKRNKRVYVNSILKLAKKAEGGEEKKSDEDPEAGDPTGKKIRKQKLNNFISSLKKETEMFNLKQQAEQEYDQMMQQQMQPQNDMMRRGGSAGSRDPKVVRGNELKYRANQLKDFITGQNRRDREDNIDYFNVNDYPTTTFEEGDYNKDGYVDATDYAVKGQFNERNNTCFEDENGQTNCFPRRNENSNNEMHSYDHPSYSVDVRKSNWLTGKPSKYRIDFYGYSPLVDIANGNNPDVVSQKPVVKSSQSTVSSTVATIINKSQSTDLPKQGTLLPHGFFTTDANSDKIPDYLQPGKFSTLPTGTSKEVITQATVNPNATVANTPIISSVYKPEVKRNSSPTLIEIKKNKVIIPENQIPKFTTTNKKKTTTKKTKKKSDYYYRDPSFMERLGRFFDPNLENGGFVDSENPDLYEFNQGGYDPTQQDMDYSNSIDTTDPYFQRGGGVRKFIENYFPGNILSPQRTYRNEIQRVYDPRTGKTIVMPINMGNLSSINVDKTRFWSGRPKKYTMYFNGQSGQPITTSKGTDASQRGRDRYCLDFPNSPNCQGAKKPVRDNYPEDTRENNKNQRSGRQGYGFINNLKLRMQGLDEYGNPIGGKPIKKYDPYADFPLDHPYRNTGRLDIKSNQDTMNQLRNTQSKELQGIPFSSDQLINTSGPRNTEMQYGGNLDMFLPRAEDGFQTSMSPGECPMGSTKNAAGDCVDFMGKVVKKRSTGSDFGNNIQDIKQPGVIDKDYRNPLTGEKPGVIKDKSGNLQINEDKPSFNDMYAVDVENKKDLAFGANADTSKNEARLQTFNAGVDVIDGIRKNIESRKKENEMYENLSSNNLYASDPSRDKGDYDTNSGLYRPDEQGQMWNSRSAQYGGYIDEEEYYDPYTEEDEEDELTYAEGGEKITYMSEDQIRAFMAEGGQVEFL